MSRKENNAKRTAIGTSLPVAYHIEFNTKDMANPDGQPNIIVATKVTLSLDYIRPKQVMNINLNDHPLYAKLHRYCMENPPRTYEKTE